MRKSGKTLWGNGKQITRGDFGILSPHSGGRVHLQFGWHDRLGTASPVLPIAGDNFERTGGRNVEGKDKGKG
jgi:hypothetical protein